MALNTATGATISLPSFASSFEARSTHSSRSNSPGLRLHHYRPYSESNTRGAPPDDRSRKRPAPIDEEPELDVGTQNNPEQDVVNESGELSTVPVKEEQVSELEQSPSPSPSAGESRRYAHALPRPTAQTQFAPTPPTSAHHVSPPHVALPTLPQRHRDADLTLVLHAPPEPQPQPQQADHHYDEPTPARKRRRVTVSGVAAGSEAAPLPLHRTVLERANNGCQSYDPPPQSLPAGQTATLASPTIPPPVQNTITPPTLPTTTPTAPTDPLAQTQALAHRRGKGLSKLIIPLNSSISSVQDANGRLGIPDIRAAIRSAPPDITRFNLPYTQRPQPAQVRDVRPLKERSVSIQRIHADSTASTTAAPAPLGIVAPGQPPVLNAPTPSSSHIVTPTQFPLHTSHPQSPRTPTKSESILSKREQSSNSTPRTSEMVIHSAMMPSDIAGVLEIHGCENLTHKLDQSTCSTFPLSSGGLGDIYLGIIDGIKVAIKTTRLHIVNKDKKYLKHAAKELHTWSKCRHPNVLRLLGFVEFRGQIGMVSMWIGNGNVQTYLKERPQTDRCEMCHRISDGLAYLHDTGIIHGDLKGANVLIADDGAPMLSDFGNSVLRDQSLQLTRTTVQINVSPRWTAPEILEGLTLYSYAADVYALGMTFLEVMTGKVPFHELQRDQAVYTAIVIRNKTPERPERHIPVDSRDGDALWSLLNKCWAYKPDDRPSAVDAQIQIRRITHDGLRDMSGRVYIVETTMEEMSPDDEGKPPSELEHS